MGNHFYSFITHLFPMKHTYVFIQKNDAFVIFASVLHYNNSTASNEFNFQLIERINMCLIYSEKIVFK